MTKTWVKHLKRCATVVLVNEFHTSQLCAWCQKALHQLKNCFRLKRCLNSDCNRDFWNRDVNAAINILNLFLAVVLYKGHRKHRCCTASAESREAAFKRKAAGDE